jgi:hypothetical protein
MLLFFVFGRVINMSLTNFPIVQEMRFSSRQHFWTTTPCYISPPLSNLHMTTQSFCDPHHHMCAHISLLLHGIFNSYLPIWTTQSHSRPSIHLLHHRTNPLCLDIPFGSASTIKLICVDGLSTLQSQCSRTFLRVLPTSIACSDDRECLHM